MKLRLMKTRIIFLICIFILILTVIFSYIAYMDKRARKKNNEDALAYEIPDEIIALYNRYADIVERYNTQIHDEDSTENDITISELSIRTNNLGYIDYDFYICENIISIEYHNGEFYSYYIDFSDSSNDIETQNTIAIAMAVSEDKAISKVEPYMQDLLNTYDENSKSKTISTEKYNYTLIVAFDRFYPTELVIVPIENEIEINKSEYPERNNEYLQNSMNVDENVSIKGTVINEHEPHYPYINYIEVTNNTGTYLISYSIQKYEGNFEIGKEYSFYGKITERNKNYTGCMEAEYYNKVE